MVPCPYCTAGYRTLRIFRFLLDPSAPRDAWVYPEPAEGWVEQRVPCVVCGGTGEVEPFRRAAERTKEPPEEPLSEPVGRCEWCGDRDATGCMAVEVRAGPDRSWGGPREVRCAVCRSKTRGGWRYPREAKKRHLQVV